MPPYHTGTDRQPPPLPQRQTLDNAARPAEYADQYAARHSDEIAPPPLPRQQRPQPNPQTQPQQQPPRLQPWPLQSAEEKLREPPRPASSDNDVEELSDEPTQNAPARTQHRLSAAAYLLAGFVAGAVFWHAVGFWSLVRDLVFSGPRMTASDGTPLPVVNATPQPKQPPAVTFDEEKLRDHASRPAVAGARAEPSTITTGSISAPTPDEVRRPQDTRPSTEHTSTASPDGSEEPPVILGPGGISWTPAVSKAP